MFTNLESLHGFPERLGGLRRRTYVSSKEWEELRRREQEFVNDEPEVLVVGGGHSGLEIAARLKVLDIKNVVIESNARIGDNWRMRHDSLCLHWPLCALSHLSTTHSSLQDLIDTDD